MSKKYKCILCPFCGEENVAGSSVCCKCGRIIRVKEKAPVDFRPIGSLIFILALIAAIVAAVAGINDNWAEIYQWGSENSSTLSGLEVGAEVIISAMITAKISDTTNFADLYGICFVVSLIVIVIMSVMESFITGNNNEFDGQLISLFVVTAIYAAISAVLVFLVRLLKKL